MCLLSPGDTCRTPAVAVWLVVHHSDGWSQAVAAHDAICNGSPWRGNRRPPRVMPAKNIATTVKTIMASFRGGLSPRICLSKSSQSRCSISKSPLPGICIGEREKKSSGSLHSPCIEGYLPAICGTAALYCGTAVPSDRVSSDPGESEHSTREVFTSRRSWPMPHLPNNPDRDFSADPSEDDINANVVELFASRPLGLAELFADQIVQMRVGRLITETMIKRAWPQRAHRSR